MLQLDSWGAGSEGVRGEGGITRGAASGDGVAGAAGSTFGGRAGANLVGWTRGCTGPGEERICH